LECHNIGILIDAGIGVRTIKKRLKEQGIGLEQVCAVLVTHDHSDHIKSIVPLVESLHIPVYTTAAIEGGINRSHCVGNKLVGCVKRIEKGIPFQIFDFRIEAFEIPHDATDSVGFFIEAADVSIVFVTDLGEITTMAAAYLQRARYLVLEANYDTEMLIAGSYPYYLQQRIASSIGHLSNTDMAAFLGTAWQSHWQNIWLCHLSKDNNTPERALQAVSEALESRQIPEENRCPIAVLQRHVSTGPFLLD
jgi:phosphoribosyl 1,2-cyclic phosphodiesterase